MKGLEVCKNTHANIYLFPKVLGHCPLLSIKKGILRYFSLTEQKEGGWRHFGRDVEVPNREQRTCGAQEFP